MFSFIHSYHPQPIIFQLGFLSVYWYGLLISAGVLSGLILTLFLAKKFRVDKNHIWNLVFYFIVFGVAGARIFYVLFYDWPYFWKNPGDIFKIWEGGFSIHGAAAASILVLYFYCKKNHLSFWFLADLLSPALIFGQAVGRWGNYFNQELFGLPTNLPWGIPIDSANRPENWLNLEYFHPAFLYESIWDILVFAVLMILIRRIFTRTNPDARAGIQIKQGNVFLAYLIFYSLGRFFLEFSRIDPQPVFFGLKMGQIISLAIILAAGIKFGRDFLKPMDIEKGAPKR